MLYFLGVVVLVVVGFLLRKKISPWYKAGGLEEELKDKNKK